MSSKAFCVRVTAIGMEGIPYYLGEEFKYVVGPEQTRRLDGDCSALPYAVWRECGVRVNNRPIPTTWRWTAHDLYKMAAPIARPSHVGDLGFLLRNGHAHHTFMYVVRGPMGRENLSIVEAGDGTGKVGLHSVTHENARGAVWGRIKTDIEELIEEEDMAIDTVSNETVKPYLKKLTDAGIINRPDDHPFDDAASVGLLWVVIGRLLETVEELKRGN